ncbi:hypothetical protein MAMT_00028 [Methylacidimicrobium tartarophylax]|uniref:Polymer-forming cytoskeletal protein n=2 Tax=Methylacidimicrobium tartarophylax TaxID=1041768 RepID=A0A5E6M4S5_9BACT|nr:hypothetical protein MAMT_00028 [Methylacidimicrobium tartarophylax]
MASSPEGPPSPQKTPTSPLPVIPCPVGEAKTPKAEERAPEPLISVLVPQVCRVPSLPEVPEPEEETDVIGAGTQLRGTIAFAGTLVIHGGFVGSVHAPEGTVRIGAEGQVEADVEAAELQVEGKARGSFFAHDLIELREGADVHGNMRCARLQIAREAAFEGFCECHRPSSPEPEKRMDRPDLDDFFTAVRIASLRP